MKKLLTVIIFLLLSLLLSSCHKKPGPTSEAGEQSIHTMNGVGFHMRLVPGGLTFPTGLLDTETAVVDGTYWIAETPVTYELWHTVYTWAVDSDRGDKKYYFAHSGREGSHGNTGQKPTERKKEPVTGISWHDAVVWCNALTEYYNEHNGTNWDCTYTYRRRVIRDSRFNNAVACDNAVTAKGAKGFRLPTRHEWELAARFIGQEPPAFEPLQSEAVLIEDFYWLPGNYAAGAKGPYYDEEATMEAAWYYENTNIDGAGHKTQNTGLKPVNGNYLGLYDMNGNVWEWCFNWHPAYVNSYRILCGGGWNESAGLLQAGNLGFFHPGTVFNDRGFRLARSD